MELIISYLQYGFRFCNCCTEHLTFLEIHWNIYFSFLKYLVCRFLLFTFFHFFHPFFFILHSLLLFVHFLRDSSVHRPLQPQSLVNTIVKLHIEKWRKRKNENKKARNESNKGNPYADWNKQCLMKQCQAAVCLSA